MADNLPDLLAYEKTLPNFMQMAKAQAPLHMNRAVCVGSKLTGAYRLDDRYRSATVVLKDGQSAEEGQVIAENLMKQLGVKEEHLITGAYMDLILKK